MRYSFVIALCLLAGCGTEPELPPMPKVSGGQALEAAAYPVLLVESRWILCVCKTADELRRRNENEPSRLERDGEVIDAAGTRFRVGDVRVVKGPRNAFVKLLSGTFVTGDPIAMDFRLYPETTAGSNRAVWQKMEQHHYGLRHCGLGPTVPAVQLLRGLQDRRCVFPPL